MRCKRKIYMCNTCRYIIVEESKDFQRLSCEAGLGRLFMYQRLSGANIPGHCNVSSQTKEGKRALRTLNFM